MLALLNGYSTDTAAEREVLEIKDLFYDEDYGLCFISSEGELYYFPKTKLTVRESADICEKAFRDGKVNLSLLGSYEEYPDN